MDNISELIEAGENVLRKHKSQNSNVDEGLSVKPRPSISSLRGTSFVVTRDSDSGCFTNDQAIDPGIEMPKSVSNFSINNNKIEELLSVEKDKGKSAELYSAESQKSSKERLVVNIF